jgi:hypothetical protein
MDDERAGVGGVVLGEIVLVGRTREELVSIDVRSSGLANRDPIVEGEIHRLAQSISDKFDVMDREDEAKYGIRPRFEIPKCKGGGCELAWAFKVHLGTLRDRDRGVR